MHNGRVAGFQFIRRALLGRLSDQAFQLISGSTDSEYVFALFSDHYRRVSKKQSRTEAMVAALTGAIAEVEELTQEAGIAEPSFLNLAVTDGRCAVISRYNSRDPEKANSLYVHSGAATSAPTGFVEWLSRRRAAKP